jgi:hypothetical protein
MMVNISGSGLELTLIATGAFPAGFQITQFADDGDPLDFPSIDIAGTGMGLNGDLVVYNTPNPITVTLNVIPNSTDDTNLSILFQLNRVGRGKKSINSTITMIGVYPDNRVVTLINGVITSGQPSNSISSDGRMKSKAYSFVFENIVKA